ncbi:MAG TPA: nitrous oxide-stimulated promoter family protein [Firmicutes bacterium]|nr:nitrous oxide-stimulated promoter family protein [Bacillota bacterium]
MKKGRVEKEKEIIEVMIKLYCMKQHGHKETLCMECDELLEYAHKRLTVCKFGDKKTACQKCPIQCYKKDMKRKVKDVMKFSGPRILLYHPIFFIKHLFY